MDCPTPNIFLAPFEGSSRKNWCHIIKLVLKVDDIMWTHNYIFLFKKKLYRVLKNMFIFSTFPLFFSLNRYSVYFERKASNSESTLFTQLLKLIWECGLSLSYGTFKNGLKCTQCWTIKYVQGPGKAQALATLALILTEKYIVPSPHYLTNFKTDLKIGQQFLCSDLQKWSKMRWMLDNTFLYTLHK